MIIGGSEVHTEKKNNIVVPHNHKHTIGSYSIANENHVKDAIKSALGEGYEYYLQGNIIKYIWRYT